ncbi:MAG: RnfABCDGE type electron transport complex subunit D, partial [Erysipelotrichaceae bacterium]|nr:RnfABCDGE type electron transport complex subunit D [Erysipelotrichaceae bacterium]
MKFLYSASPNLRGKLSTRKIMLELMIGLLVVYGFSLFYYFTEHGMAVALHSLILMATSLIVMAITEVGFAYFTKQDIIPFLSNSFGWI